MSKHLDILSKGIDFIYNRTPRRPPSIHKLREAKVIAHRGDHRHHKENSLNAFASCHAAGVWGVEFDVRWTLDHEPIIIHDPTADRVHGRADITITKIEFKKLRDEIPAIAHLEEALESLKTKCHLMIEIKENLSEREASLKKFVNLLRPFHPVSDFHILSLNTDFFIPLHPYFPSQTFLPVASTNTNILSNISLNKSYAGIAGQFLLTTQDFIKCHHEHQQKVGTGFINEKNLLYREVTRGIDWIFSDNAIEIQNHLRVCQP